MRHSFSRMKKVWKLYFVLTFFGIMSLLFYVYENEMIPASSPQRKVPISLTGGKFPASPLRKTTPSSPLRKNSALSKPKRMYYPESHLFPLRGIGDSFLPFKETSTNIEAAPQHFWSEKNMTKATVNALDSESPPLKKILFWNDVFGNYSFYFGFGREPFVKAKCRVNSCFTTSDRSLFSLEEVDAVVWHSRSDDQSLPSKRSPHTRYVFWSWESAHYMFDNLQQFKNVFNWTFTYRVDSDFPNPFNVVPVVYGLMNYTAKLPPKSYIDALAFPTAKSLATYLMFLHKNDAAYNEYFRWKVYHQFPSEWGLLAKP